MRRKKIEIQGSVTDTSGTRIPYATIRIFALPADSLAGGHVADKNGRFSLLLQQGETYRIEASCISYEELSKTIYAKEEAVCNFALTPTAYNINEARIIASNLKYSAGKYTINMEGNPIAEDRTAMQVMDLIPGVRSDGNSIEINGKQAVAIYINGMETSMDEIKYLPADKISKIEISNISGSSYSAMMQGGIIKIDLRKLHDGNYFGSGDLYAFAYDNKFGTSISAPVYSKRGKFSIYNFLKASYVYEEAIAGANAEYINEGYGIDIENTSYLKNRFAKDAFNLVYDINKFQAIGIAAVVLGNSVSSSSIQNSDFRETAANASGMPYENSKYRTDAKMTNMQYQAGINYVLAYDTTGSRITIKADYIYRDISKDYDYMTSSILSSYQGGTHVSRYKEYYTPKYGTLRARAEANHIFGENRSLKAGITWSMDDADDRMETENISGSTENEEGLFFINRNTAGTAFLEYSDKFDRFSIYAGASLEWNMVSYKDMLGGTSVRKDYVRPFGNLSLSYDINPNKGTYINLDFSRMSGYAPSYSQLSPKKTRQSEFVYYMGNESLDIPTGYDVSLSYMLKGNWFFSYSFSVWDKQIINIQNTEDNGIVFIRPVNQGYSYSYSILATWDSRITKWLRLGAFASASCVKSGYGKYLSESFSANVSADMYFRILPTLGLDLGVSWTSPVEMMGFKQYGDLMVDGTIYKTFLDKKLYLGINFCFYSNYRVLYWQLDNSYKMYSERFKGSRKHVGLTLRYNFENRPQKVKTVNLLQEVSEL